jgi:hypothetical protein
MTEEELEIYKLRRDLNDVQIELRELYAKCRDLKLHACLEWDGLIIDKNDPEFESCGCYNSFIKD